jgi:hypothetical protein
VIRDKEYQMRVLISHGPEDREVARVLARSLAQRGIETRFDNLYAGCGSDLDVPVERIVKALKAYDYFIPVLSHAYHNARWLARELFAALYHQTSSQSPFVIPVVVDDSVIPVEAAAPIYFDPQGVPSFITEVANRLAGQRQLFIIMKFGDPELDSMYKLAVKPTANKFGLTTLRIDEITNSGSINEQLLKAIDRAPLIFSDLTGERPNCYFETGYALALGKELILSVRSGENVHFDLRDRRMIMWHTAAELAEQLDARLSALQGSGAL